MSDVGAAPNPARILLVDDNESLVENLREVLGGEGYETRAASSCARARAVASQGLDVALIDLRLPDGEGTSLAAELKTLAPDAEVILLTGFATLESATAAVRAGAWAYLLKPCAIPELLRTIEQAMRQVRLKAETRELARRAQVAEKLAAVGTLTAGLSHEIRNPLNAAALQLAVLERRVRRLHEGEQGPLLQPLELVQHEIRRLDHILEDFLQFARPRELVLQPVSLTALADAVLALLSPQAAKRGVRVERRGLVEGGAQADVSGDEPRLRQVFMNLMLNAIQASPAGGGVRVAVEPRGEEVVVTVDDDGPGLAPEVRARIFEPFFTTKPDGTGLGLSIVHAIVAQHGGRIDAGAAEGGGARFQVRIPRRR